MPENLYITNNYIIPKRRDEKFEVPILQYDIDNNYIKTYETIKIAAKENNMISYKIYEVAIGNKKSLKGFKYKFLTS